MVIMSDEQGAPREWVLLTYRLPREPSTPRLALWRKLKRLGVAQLADGLVALPADARTREQLEWAAEDVDQGGGTAGVWFARPATTELERAVAAQMDAARAGEYTDVITQARATAALDAPERTQVLRKLRGQMRQIERRDFFRPPQHENARQALRDLAEQTVQNQEVSP